MLNLIPKKHRLPSWKVRLVLAMSMSVLFVFVHCSMLAKADEETVPVNVSASFAKKEWVSPSEIIELHLSRPLGPAEGALAIFINHTDITSLFDSTKRKLRYSSQALPLPNGENSLIVYLISSDSTWKEIARFPLRVKRATDSDQLQLSGSTTTNGRRHGLDKFDVKPSLALNLKAQSHLLFFPSTQRPDRINSTDLTFQSSLQTNLARGDFSYQNQFDVLGTTFQKEALRFGERNIDAPQIDLSSYLMQFQVKKVKVVLGHHSFGSNRYLIQDFSSRGINVTLPMTSSLDLSFNATNGTSIVGWNNFSGLGRRKHKVIAGNLGYEFFSKHPGWLRFEVGMLRGSLLPENNFNRGALTDAEESRGLGFRVVATDSNGRFRLDAGYARSRFGNPTDPLLDQGFSVVSVRETTRNAHYLDLTFQILKDRALTKDRKVNLSLTFRHNRVDPLFRSVAVFTQADRADNQFELTGSLGDITVGAVHNRLSDNLDDVPSILKTLTRRQGFTLGLPLVSVVGKGEGFAKWLPRLSYNYDRTHAFGAFLPINSGFSLSHVPDQASTNQSFNAEWQRQNLRFGYRLNNSFQDNRQVGRANSDFRTLVNAITFGVTPHRKLELNFDFGSERASNFEVNRLDRTWRATFSSTFQTTKQSILSANISSAFASDAANISRNRNADLDLQWAWRFGVEKSPYRKVQGQFFIKYLNRYASAQDNFFFFHNLTKVQAMTGGISITLF
jgi:hypothetical protein